MHRSTAGLSVASAAEHPVVPPCFSGVTPLPGPVLFFYRGGMTSSHASSTVVVPESAAAEAPTFDERAEPAAGPDGASDASADPATESQLPSTSPQPAASTPVGKSSARTMSILALSLGIASVFFAQTIVVPLAAVILGVFGLRDEPTGRGFSIWGIVLACVATFGWVFIVIAGALFSLPFILLGAAF